MTQRQMLCECGCGNPAPISLATNSRRGHIKGYPVRFCQGHNARLRRAASYRFVGSLRVHQVRAQLALGRPLPLRAVVHHADGSRRDDATLVICQDQGYHMELHRKMRVVKSGGNPWTDRVCGICEKPKDIGEFTQYRDYSRSGIVRYSSYCKTCAATRSRDSRKDRKMA